MQLADFVNSRYFVIKMIEIWTELVEASTTVLS
jgi:hypothetical protein